MELFDKLSEESLAAGDPDARRCRNSSIRVTSVYDPAKVAGYRLPQSKILTWKPQNLSRQGSVQTIQSVSSLDALDSDGIDNNDGNDFKIALKPTPPRGRLNRMASMSDLGSSRGGPIAPLEPLPNRLRNMTSSSIDNTKYMNIPVTVKENVKTEGDKKTEGAVPSVAVSNTTVDNEDGVTNIIDQFVQRIEVNQPTEPTEATLSDTHVENAEFTITTGTGTGDISRCGSNDSTMGVFYDSAADNDEQEGILNIGFETNGVDGNLITTVSDPHVTDMSDQFPILNQKRRNL